MFFATSWICASYKFSSVIRHPLFSPCICVSTLLVSYVRGQPSLTLWMFNNALLQQCFITSILHHLHCYQRISPLHGNRSQTLGNPFQKFPRSRELRNGYETFQNAWEPFRELGNYLGTSNTKSWELGNFKSAVPHFGSLHTLRFSRELPAVPKPAK